MDSNSRHTILNIASLIESHGASTKRTSNCEQIKGTSIIGHISKHQKWYKKVRKALKRENDEDGNETAGVCIFRVPNHVAIVKPEAYAPQLIGLGAYHHFEPAELYEMEDYKLAAVKRALAWVGEDHRQLQEFDEIVAKISKLHCPSMCDAYRGLENDHNHKFLAWIMAVDALFLFDLMSQRNKFKGGTDPHAILKDVLKLENQIPMTVLKAINSKVMEKKSRPDSVKDHPKQLVLHLRGMLVNFCNDVSPLDLDWESILPSNLAKSLEFRHLLDLLYHYITYDPDPNPNKISNNTPQQAPKPKPSTSSGSSLTCEPFSKFFTKLSSNAKVGSFVKHLQELITAILFFIPTSALESWKEKKVLIPSVSELHSVGVEFKPIEHGGTQKVEFNEETKTFHLPVVILKPTTEVVLRNLVAYETMAKSKSHPI